MLAKTSYTSTSFAGLFRNYASKICPIMREYHHISVTSFSGSNLSIFSQSMLSRRSSTIFDGKLAISPLRNNLKGRIRYCSTEIKPSVEDHLRIPQFIGQYQHLQPKERDSKIHSINGRVVRVRKSSKKLVFLDLYEDNCRLQIVLSFTTLQQQAPLNADEFLAAYGDIKPGDAVNFSGFAFRTSAGELSLRATSKPHVLASSVASVPKNASIGETKGANFKVRNMIHDPPRRVPLLVRSVVVNSLREFLITRGFTEVETPIVANTANGATATPFTTSSIHLKDEMLKLRVAPELYLKKLVIGGFDKVFEIGKVFRNEGIDHVHNPEFTTCEFYQTYTDLEQLIEMTRILLVQVAHDVEMYSKPHPGQLNLGWDKIQATAQEIGLSLVNGFQRFDFIQTIEQNSGVSLPCDLSNLEELVQYFLRLNIELPAAVSVPSLLDSLAGRFIEPFCEKPSIIINHPVQLSPLAKSYTKTYSGREYEVSKRFELFIHRKEYVNAYEEENDAASQEFKFAAQLGFRKDSNDKEISMLPDANFVEALQYGMPPTGGWGCGIDRLVMLLCGSEKIEEVLSFGSLKDVSRY